MLGIKRATKETVAAVQTTGRQLVLAVAVAIVLSLAALVMGVMAYVAAS